MALYVIQRKSDGKYWVDENKWVKNIQAAWVENSMWSREILEKGERRVRVYLVRKKPKEK